MEFVEGDDEPSFRRPPDPDDRIWRHPSEIGLRAAPARSGPTYRSLWVVAAVSAVGASVLTATIVLTVSVLDDSAVDGSRPATTADLATAVDTPGDAGAEPVAAVARRARPSIVQLQVRRGSDGTTGSGVIFRADGYVITNAHVLEGAVSIKGILSDGRSVPATVVGADADSDIGVVLLEGGPFEAAELGSSAQLEVGQRAVAIGSPLALAGGPSVTAGVISALHRTVRTQGGKPLYDMIQTDAPISPGSSGGALCDIAGRVVGIVTAVSPPGAGTEALGFATPAELAHAVATQLVASGRATPVWLGIEGIDLDGGTAHSLGVAGGAQVNVVRADSPAAAAGLEPRDVIVSVNGKAVRSMGSLVAALRMLEPGQEVPVEVRRNGRAHAVRVVLAERPHSE